MSESRNEAFSPVSVVIMVVMGVACFAGFVVLFAFAQGPSARDGGAHAASVSAIGFAGLVKLLQATGTPTLTSRSRTIEDAPGGGLLVLTPPPGTLPPLNVTDRVRADTVLLVLPKWRTTPLDDHPGWIQSAGLLPADTVLTTLPGKRGKTVLVRRPGSVVPRLTIADKDFKAALQPGPIESLQVLDHSSLTPVITDAAGGVLLGLADDLFVLSDPDLLNNAGLHDARGATAAAALIQQLADSRPVTFDLSLDGFGRSRNPLQAIFQPPLLGTTLCAVAACLLAGLLSAVRFGPALAARRSFELGKTALAGNSAALIARAGREARMAVPYAELTRNLTARSLGLSRQLGPADTAAALDRMATQGAPGLRTLLERADAVHDRASLLAAAKSLYRWRQELVRGHR